MSTDRRLRAVICAAILKGPLPPAPSRFHFALCKARFFIVANLASGIPRHLSVELIQVKEERERERPRTFSRCSCRCRNEARSPFLSSPLVLFLSFFLQMNGWRFSAVRRNTMVSRRREVIPDGWKVGIIERGEKGRRKAKRRRQGDGGLISQGYIWNLMEAEFCRPPSVLCTQADFSRGLAYKSI